MFRRVLSATVALALCAPLSAFAAVFVNELHYDDSTAAGDTGESIEIVATNGETLSDYSIVLYNGSSTPAAAVTYDTDPVPAGALVSCGAQVRIATLSYPTNGIQNGGTDGIALVGPGNVVVQFLSYEGAITASNGPAAGLTSTDIGQVETNGTVPGTSLQLNGTGTVYADFTWSASAAQTFGACNTTQTFASLVDNPPSLSSTTPADNATGVAVASAITLVFTESVTTGPDPWFALTCGGNPVAATASGSAGTRTITPTTALPFGTACAVALDESRILDGDGTPDALVAGTLGYTDFDFTTLADAAPTVSGILPANGAAGVPATTNIVITFSEDVSVPGTASDWITLTCNGTPVAGSVSGGPGAYTFDPTPVLTPSATCNVELTAAAILDTDGTPNALAGATSFSFAVAADVAPTVTSTYPVDNAVSVPPGDDLTVTFSEAVDASAAAFVLQCPAGTTIATASSSTNGFTYSIDPVDELPSDTTCVLTIVASQIADRDGTPTAPAANVVIDFTTGAGLLSYYSRVDASSCRTLRATLHGVIDDHYPVVYTDTGNTWTDGDPSTFDVWEVLNLADEDPLDPTKVLDIYKNESYTKIDGGTAIYNREHTWPNSHGFNDVLTLDGGPFAPYTDTHMLMVSNSTYNSNRSNRAYAKCDAACDINPTTFNPSNNDGGGPLAYPATGPTDHNWASALNGGDGSYEVWDGRRGDVARGMLYMDVRYEGGTNPRSGQRETDLILTDTRALIVNTANGVFQTVGHSGLLSPLLTWATQDPVTSREGLRNDVVESVQKNRNPFVDHPEWIEIAFAPTCSGPDVVAVDDDFTTGAGQQLVAAAPGMLRDDRNGANKNGENLTAAITLVAGNGSVALTNASTGAFTYTPTAGVCGRDSFAYTASNGTASDLGLVHVVVACGAGNNHAPVVSDSRFTLAEGSANGAAVGQVTAADEDGNGLVYAIAAGNEAGVFAINPATGAITVANASGLDADVTPSYTLLVRVTDNGTTAASGTGTIRVVVSGVAGPLIFRNGFEG